MKPVLQALVLADQVYVDALSGKKVIAGTFSTLWSEKFPWVFSRTTYAFISLTEVDQGEVTLQLRYVDLSNNQVLMKCEFGVKSPGPLTTVELVTEVPSFPMPHEGAYAFELLWQDEIIGSLRISVEKMSSGAESHSEEGDNE